MIAGSTQIARPPAAVVSTAYSKQESAVDEKKPKSLLLKPAGDHDEKKPIIPAVLPKCEHHKRRQPTATVSRPPEGYDATENITDVAAPPISRPNVSDVSEPPPAESSANIDQPSNSTLNQNLICDHGTHIYKAKNYHDSLMKTAQKLSAVTNVTSRMEQNGG